jgi:hypothetical protein
MQLSVFFYIHISSMCKIFISLFCLFAFFLSGVSAPSAQTARNPIIYADVPDISIIRVGKTYYMSSTTMHLSPGVPIMKSTDLVNWKLVSYAYDVLDNTDDMNLSQRHLLCIYFCREYRQNIYLYHARYRRRPLESLIL